MYDTLIGGAVAIICAFLPIWAKYRENQRKKLDKKIDSRFDKIEESIEKLSQLHNQTSTLLVDVARSSFVNDCSNNIERGYRTEKSTLRILNLYQDYNEMIEKLGVQNGYVDDMHHRFLDLPVK